jgi:cob(I)alamin adenosyltransferase
MNKTAPAIRSHRSQLKNRGLVQVYTGDGKGKTTAALGLAMRAAGAGLRTAIVYFDKGGDHYSERQVLAEDMRGRIDFIATGLDRIDPKTGVFRFGVTPADKKEVVRGLDAVKGLFRKKEHDLIVLDEIITAVTIGLVDEDAVVALVKAKPPEAELVLTGRHCPESLIGLADLVSEIRDVKHYFRAGVRARRGLDY